MAVIWCEPAASVAVESIATPLGFTGVLPKVVLPSLNVTVPVAVPELPVTVAVN